ncbi:MFS transporter [Listeria monocytogenes]|nr:MFS transporter [Listeria monocytogenes]EKZ0266366.1 MFS transporter [Listeria monocytogenes]
MILKNLELRLILNMFSNIINLPKNIRYRFLISFFNRIFSSCYIPVLPIYMSGYISSSEVSLALALILCLNILGNFIGGVLGDNYNLKQLIALIRGIETIIFVSLAVCIWASINIWTIIILFSLVTFTSSLRVPLFDMLVFNAVSSENQNYVFSLSYWINNIGFSVGYLLSAFVFKGNMFSIICMGIIVNIISIPAINSLEDDYTSQSKSNVKANLIEVIKIYQNKKFIIFSFGSILLLFLELQLSNFIGIFLNRNFIDTIFHYKVTGIQALGIIQFINVFLTVLIPILSKKMMKSISTYSFIIGIILYGIGFLSLVWFYSYGVIAMVISTIIFTIGELLFFPNQQVVFKNIMPEKHRGKYLAARQINTQLSRLIASVSLVLFLSVSYVLVGFIYFIVAIVGGAFIIYLRKITLRLEHEK